MPTDPAKVALRRAAREARLGLPTDYRRQASRLACERLLSLAEVQAARTIALYVALGPELDVGDAIVRLADKGTATLFPRVAGDVIEFAPASSIDELRPGFRGVLEPQSDAVDYPGIDVVVVPGVAFDLAGGRLGQGGGHYDRSLARLAAGTFRAGVCFQCQIVTAVPRLRHDELVDAVVTEELVAYTGARA